jgi:hypothetical protein
MDQRVETLVAFVKLIQNKGKSFLGKIITMDNHRVGCVYAHSHNENAVEKVAKKGHTRPD